MRAIIQEFIEDKKVAIVGASPNKDNFGRSLIQELSKKDYKVFPVNPKYKEVEGIACVPGVKELPGEVENVILAIPPALTDEVIDQCVGTNVKRVWIIRCVVRGAYSEKAHKTCQDNGIDVVYDFCPMMFLGGGIHQFHFWLRKTFGKLPSEYILAEN